MDRALKEEREYLLNICKQIKKAGCNVLLIQKSILRFVPAAPRAQSLLLGVCAGMPCRSWRCTSSPSSRSWWSRTWSARTLSLWARWARSLSSARHLLTRSPADSGLPAGGQPGPLCGRGAGLGRAGRGAGRGRRRQAGQGDRRAGRRPRRLHPAARLQQAGAGRGRALAARRALRRALPGQEAVRRACAAHARSADSRASCSALLCGGGAPEMEVACRLRQRAQSVPGVEAYCWRAYADALEIVPFTLTENAGLSPIATVTELRARHAAGESAAGINVRKVRQLLLAGSRRDRVRVRRVAWPTWPTRTCCSRCWCRWARWTWPPRRCARSSRSTTLWAENKPTLDQLGHFSRFRWTPCAELAKCPTSPVDVASCWFSSHGLLFLLLLVLSSWNKFFFVDVTSCLSEQHSLLFTLICYFCMNLFYQLAKKLPKAYLAGTFCPSCVLIQWMMKKGIDGKTHTKRPGMC